MQLNELNVKVALWHSYLQAMAAWGEKVTKICHFVISDIIKTDFSAVHHDVTRETEVDG